VSFKEEYTAELCHASQDHAVFERHVAGTMEGCGSSSRSHVMKTLLNKLVRDEQGGEVLEYALIAGLIVVAAIAVITSVGSKVLARWTSLNASL
jgi:Flp pilus assembly pilin Flp